MLWNLGRLPRLRRIFVSFWGISRIWILYLYHSSLPLTREQSATLIGIGRTDSSFHSFPTLRIWTRDKSIKLILRLTRFDSYNHMHHFSWLRSRLTEINETYWHLYPIWHALTLPFLGIFSKPICFAASSLSERYQSLLPDWLQSSIGLQLQRLITIRHWGAKSRYPSW